jgi:hypothetical protein
MLLVRDRWPYRVTGGISPDRFRWGYCSSCWICRECSGTDEVLVFLGAGLLQSSHGSRHFSSALYSSFISEWDLAETGFCSTSRQALACHPKVCFVLSALTVGENSTKHKLSFQTEICFNTMSLYDFMMLFLDTGSTLPLPLPFTIYRGHEQVSVAAVAWLNISIVPFSYLGLVTVCLDFGFTWLSSLSPVEFRDESKAFPLLTLEALVGRGVTAPSISWTRH